ncbi:hypothetical protein GcM1_c16882o17 [Golovinomyces cichoracearum]|uniref:Uncharacterized protein n=1 Tax=Golovinomyces cichoracearum TaxID=62708 RepID=A0A420ITQ8_9PEZI|nr:hypothetical protein GcM1_c16882o17 [Golovinomyces cichoracearum]
MYIMIVISLLLFFSCPHIFVHSNTCRFPLTPNSPLLIRRHHD